MGKKYLTVVNEKEKRNLLEGRRGKEVELSEWSYTLWLLAAGTAEVLRVGGPQWLSWCHFC